MIYPENTMRNWSSYQGKINGIGAESLLTLCDPQTSGGLLICVDAASALSFEDLAKENGYTLQPFGKLVKRNEPLITIQ
jgi:selenide,water dikinase